VTSRLPNAFVELEEGTSRVFAQWMEAVWQRGFAEEKVRASETSPCKWTAISASRRRWPPPARRWSSICTRRRTSARRAWR